MLNLDQLRFLSQRSLQQEEAELVDIFALESDREELIASGVVLGSFDAEQVCYARCLLTPSAKRRLIELGDKYLWDASPLIERESDLQSAVH